MSNDDDADLDHLAVHGMIGAAMPDATWRLVSQPGFLRHVDEFVRSNPKISSRSDFLSVDWSLNPRPPARHASECVSFRGIDFDLACQLKVALLVAMAHPSSKTVAISSAQRIGRGLSMLGGWMTHVGAASLSNLGPGCGELFMQALFEFVDLVRRGEHDPDAGDWDPREQLVVAKRTLARGGPNHGMINTAASGLIHLWEMRDEIGALTGTAMRGQPFEQTSAGLVASSWGEAGDGTTRRLPDAVLALLLAGAERLMGEPAADVVTILGDFLARYRERGDREAAAEAALRGFGFATLAGENDPWWSEARHHVQSKWFRRLARLVHLVRDAAAVLVLLAAGMRPQEFLGLMGGSQRHRLLRAEDDRAPARAAEVPRCVGETLSKTGHTVILLLLGHVFKRQARPRPVSWLIGGRQDGGADPAALDALCVLERLHAPLREYAVDGAAAMMVVDFVDAEDDGGLAVAHCNTARFAESMRRSVSLIADFSGLPDEERGVDLRRYKAQGPSRIALYQFRKTWAQVRYKLDPTLLPAISHQLQHRSIEATKTDYVTDDPDFQLELDRPRALTTRLAVAGAVRGVVDARATMAGVIDEVVSMLAPALPAEASAELWRARLPTEAAGPPRDRLRPTAGMAGILGAAGATPRGVGPDAAADGPALVREAARQRRGWLLDVAAGGAELGRPARDRALDAVRRLEAVGFTVGGLASSLGDGDDGGGGWRDGEA